MLFSAMRMNNLTFRNIMLQMHDKVDEQSKRSEYIIHYRRKRNNSVVLRWILDKYLNTHTSTISVTSRQKNIHPGQLKKYLSESYAVDAVGSTSSNLEIFCLALLFHKYNGRYMAFRWKIDKVPIIPKNVWWSGFYFSKLRQTSI